MKEEYYKTQEARDLWKKLFADAKPDQICYLINTYLLPKDWMFIGEHQQKELKK